MLSLIALSAVAPGALAADGSPVVEPGTAQIFVDKAGMTPEAATTQALLQTKAEGLADELRSIAGDRFSGIWYALHTDQRLKIGLVSADANGVLERQVRQVLEDRGIADESDIVPTRYGLSALVDAQRGLDAALGDELERGVVTTGLDVPGNGLVVDVASDVEANDRTRIQTAAADVAPPVDVHQSASRSLAVESQACYVPFCDLPMRGGVDLLGTVGSCTAGFNARSRSDGKYFVMTAGHCLEADSGTWRTATSTGYIDKIGIRHNWIFGGSGDAGIIRNWIAYWAGPPLPTAGILVPSSPYTSFNGNYGIGGVSTSSVGNPVCLTSGYPLATGYYADCGIVTGLGRTGNVDGLIVGGLGEANYCNVDGASGGPIYKNNRAYGTHVGAGGACDSYYQGATGAQNALNVNIMTR